MHLCCVLPQAPHASSAAADADKQQQQEQQQAGSSGSTAAGEEASSSGSSDSSSSSNGFGGFKQHFDSFKSRMGASGEQQQEQQEPLQQRASKLFDTIRREVADAVLPRREGYSLTRQYDGPTYQVGTCVTHPETTVLLHLAVYQTVCGIELLCSFGNSYSSSTKVM